MKKITTFICIFILSSQLSYAFIDTGSHKYKESIKYIEEKGYVSGYKDGTYKPDNLINRVEFTKIIIDAVYNVSIDKAIPKLFSDTEENAWYNPYLEIAKEKNIIKGYEDNTFRPNNNINLAEALKIILETYDIEIEKDNNKDWYLPYIEWAKENNVISSILPDDFITRGEMANIIYTTEQITLTLEDKKINELLSLLNTERQKSGLTPYKINYILSVSAKAHANDMEQNNYFSHESIDGATLENRVLDAGYKYSYIGENIALGQNNPTGVIKSWLDSPQHKDNLLSKDFTEIGIGYTNKLHWVAVFGKPKDK